MKTTLLVKAASVAALLLLCSTANAKSWRINNDTRKQANFTDINAAMSSGDVQAGDTLYLDPGSVFLSEQTITKAVTIVGNGYFLQNGMVSASIHSRVSIKAANTKLMGVAINGEVYIYANNITLERCRIFNKIRPVEADRYGLNVLQCYINSSSSGSVIYGYNYPFRNATIKNNIIRHQYYDGTYAVIDNVHDSEISNNYLVIESCPSGSKRDVLYNITNSQIYNNIIKHGTAPDYVFSNSGSASNNGFYNNVISAADGTYSNVTDIVYLGTADFSSVFAEGINDAAFRLKADSPAKGAAADGGDCGPFGGTTPYVESGLPLYHPYVKKAIVAGKSVNGEVDVMLNVKMQNE